jgi:hypothetical protein
MSRKQNDSEVIDIPSSTSLVPATSDAMTLSRVEMDMQIATAKQFPRDIELYERNGMRLVEAHLAMTKDVSEGLYYSLTRGGKAIEGPNVRLAEIIQHSYGNSRAGARVVEEGEKFVVAEGIFHDLETNSAIRMFVKRRITDREGHRYNDDMIMTTGNAAAAIAYRNAVLKGIPKSLWWGFYQRARKIAGGKTKDDTADRLAKALAMCKKYEIPEANLCERLGVKKTSQIGADQLATLVGILTAVKNHETTLAAEFKLKAERTTSDVKSSGADGVISANQILDIMTLMQDWKLKDMDLRKALDALGHKGEVTKFPAARVKELIAALEKRKK